MMCTTRFNASLLLLAILSSALQGPADAGKIKVCAKAKQDAKVVEGANVKCVDHDVITKDDFMAEGETGSDGCVELHYKTHTTKWYQCHKWWDACSSKNPDIKCSLSGECLKPTDTHVKSNHDQHKLADFGTIELEEDEAFCGDVDTKWNGCGPSTMPKWLSEIADDVSGFTDQCNYHHACYKDCSKTRSACDNEFHNDVKKMCEGKGYGCAMLANLFHRSAKNNGEGACVRSREKCTDGEKDTCKTRLRAGGNHHHHHHHDALSQQ